LWQSGAQRAVSVEAAMAEADAATRAKAASVSDGKRYQLWGPQLDEAARRAMLLDDVAIYSVTDARTADRITKLALKLGPRVRHVVDGCACVGGNVISFARALKSVAGARVTGVELDATRCAMLRHNVALAGVAATIHAGDVAAATDEGATGDLARALADCDLLFLDPPWGGPDVAARPAGSVRLAMSGVDVAALVARLGRPGFRARHALLKLPPNYDVAQLKAGLAAVADVKVETAFRKMILAVVAFKPRGPDEEDDAAAGEGGAAEEGAAAAEAAPPPPAAPGGPPPPADAAPGPADPAPAAA